MKYGIWNTALPDSAAVDALQQAGYSPLTARVLAGRGCGTPQQAQELLCADAPLFDPFLLREMDRAVQTVRQALQLGQRIAVFGDYDVDGITATCLLTDFLRSMGADCVVHIPGRLEEGYGLNAGAIPPAPCAGRAAHHHGGLRHHGAGGGRALPGAGRDARRHGSS